MNAREILAKVERPYLKEDKPRFRSGDTLQVYVKIVEGESERIQPFEGVVLRRQGSGLSETFTVRKISFGVGVERTFPLHSPRIEKIEIVKSGRTRRAKLYYLRKLSGKAARLTEKEGKETELEASAPLDAQPAAAQPAPQTKPQTKEKDSPEPVKEFVS